MNMGNVKAVNWNIPDDDFTLDFWQINIRQFWVDTEIPISDDKLSWKNDLTELERMTYMRILGGLTGLDTEQGGVGMPLIAQYTQGLQRKATLIFQGAMEQIHAKSYSTIFTTLATTEEINETFEWVEQNKYIQKKIELISEYYNNIRKPRDYYMAMVASVFLESFLFYSGFFYPLYLAGQGKMVASGEIINLIIRDESIHGTYIGTLAQEEFAKFSKRTQEKLKSEVYELLEELYVNECAYTDELYTPIGLQEEVKKFIRYNANKALMNLGYEPFFPEEAVNQIVLNGLRTETKNHDFFSTKGNGYVKTLNVIPLDDEAFKFEWLEEQQAFPVYF